jgi:FMN phosphatase YigB (HAD superfamily)
MSEPFSLGAALARVWPGEPLVIVDADEVLLRFVDGFDRFLRRQDLFLDLTSYRLHGNVKRLDDRTAILDVEVTALLDEFRADLDWLEPVEAAQDVLGALAARARIVVLTNITPNQAAPRMRNLVALGFDFPIVANSGPKGPAVKALAGRTTAPTFFVDDIPQHLVSSAEAAPDVIRIHLIGDERLKPLLTPCAQAHLYAEDWRAAGRFIANELDKAGY